MSTKSQALAQGQLAKGVRWPSGASQLQDWFVWSPTAQQAAALAGNGTPPAALNNTVDMEHAGDLVCAHHDKHFGAVRDAAQYTIGANLTGRKRIVAGMEQKAINHGMVLPGEAFFRFDRVVGTDGRSPQIATTCIRVDTPGTRSQHSHPIPENQAGMVSHDTKVKVAIQMHTVNRELDELVTLANYLRLINTANNTYSNLRANAGQYGAHRPPTCVYWAW